MHTLGIDYHNVASHKSIVRLLPLKKLSIAYANYYIVSVILYPVHPHSTVENRQMKITNVICTQLT